jgi:Glycosyl transferase family 64 domain
LDTIAANFNCEDIAMSFLISSLTGGQPPLLADTWARNTQMKLNVDDKISGGKNHKQLRDECVDSFAQQLGLKDEHPTIRLKQAPIVRNSKNAKDRFFDCGAKADGHADDNIYGKSPRELHLEALVQKWKMAKSLEIMQKDLGKMMQTAGRGAYEMGLLGSAEKRKKNKKSIE